MTKSGNGNESLRKPGRSRQSISHNLRDWIIGRPFFQRLTYVPDEKYGSQSARKDYEFSRPPKGIELGFRSIRLMELFQIEDLKRLQRGILDLFPGIEHDLNVKYTLRSLFEEAGDIFLTNAHWNVGYVARTKLYMGMPFREMAGLPKEINHVDVGVVKFTASSFALCLDAYMSDKATERLAELHSRDYPHKISLMTRLKWAILKRGFESQTSGLMRRQAVLAQLTLWRSSLETLFARNFKGYFYNQPRSDKESLLPAIEVFIFNGAPAKEEELNKWIEDSRGWWDSLGFDFFFTAFKSRTMIFSWATLNPWFPSAAHRLVFLPEAYRSSRHESLDNETHIKLEFDEDLNNLTPPIVIWHYIQIVRKRVGSLKLIALKEMQLRWWSWFWPRMRRLIRINSNIQQESMLIDRLSFEWGTRAKEVTESKARHNNMMSLLAYRSVLGLDEGERENLRDAPLKVIGVQIENLTKQLSHLRTWYAEHLNSRNTWVTYGLTIVVGFATVLGLISLRNEFRSMWKILFSLLEKILRAAGQP